MLWFILLLLGNGPRHHSLAALPAAPDARCCCPFLHGDFLNIHSRYLCLFTENVNSLAVDTLVPSTPERNTMNRCPLTSCMKVGRFQLSIMFLCHPQTWLRSYIKLFQSSCQRCGRLLQEGLPPTWRDFRTLEAFHDTCRMWTGTSCLSLHCCCNFHVFSVFH